MRAGVRARVTVDDLDDLDALLLFADGRTCVWRMTSVVPVIRTVEREPEIPGAVYREFVIASGPRPYLYEEVE